MSRVRQKFVQIEISAADRKMIDTIIEETGLSIKEWVLRMAKFFSAMDKSERGMILGSIHDSDRGQLAKMILTRLGEYPVSAEDAAAQDEAAAAVVLESEPTAPKRRPRRKTVKSK